MRGQARDTTNQMKVVAPGTTAIARLVDERADNVDAEPADGAIFRCRVQIRRAQGNWIEGRGIVDEAYVKAVSSPSECHRDGSSSRLRSKAMRYDVGEQLFENDQNPRPLVIRQTALARELVGKSLQPSEFRVLAT